ncbi:MAG: flagellar biosynthesis protein FlhF [Cryobacterium sp.]|nr:flagellar biosynthesis protein FlhF [Oligoflexia bacterium]
MQIKKFEAPSIQEALDAIKRELGPEAIILQTKKNRKGFGLMGGASVEVTAAISDRSATKRAYSESRLCEDDREMIRGLSASKQADILEKAVQRAEGRQAKTGGIQVPKKITERRYADIDAQEMPAHPPLKQRAVATNSPAATHAAQSFSAPVAPALEEEVRHLKRMIEELKIAQDDAGHAGNGFASQLHDNPALMDAFEHLLMNGVDKRYALGLVKKAGFELGPQDSKNPDAVLDQVTYELMTALDTLSPLENLVPGTRGESGPFCLALVGPTGVGKTTTLAKLASLAVLKKNLRVGLVNLDVYKVAAFDQLQTYAKILNIPFRSAENADELRSALGDFRGLDLVLIDTTGRSPRDESSLKEMAALLREIDVPVQVHLCAASSTRDLELYDIANRFSVFKPTALSITKLDESNLFGAIFNVAQKAKLPLSYFTTGQRVPEDLEEGTRERVASLIMDL